MFRGAVSLWDRGFSSLGWCVECVCIYIDLLTSLSLRIGIKEKGLKQIRTLLSYQDYF
jgi:hypothetical protein